jgi:phage baseplate assembly protein W
MNDGSLFGRSIAYPPRIGSDGRWAWSSGSDNIRESMQIILLTDAGERLMLNTFGGGLARYLFEPNTAATRRQIQQRVENALRLWEPRINVQSVRVEADPADDQRAIISIEYKLVATQASEQIALTVTFGG